MRCLDNQKLLCILSEGHATSTLPFFFFLALDEETDLCRLHTRVLLAFVCEILCFFVFASQSQRVEVPHLLRGRESRSAVGKISLVTGCKSTFPPSGTGISTPPSLAWPVTQVCSYWINALINKQKCNSNEPHPHQNPIFQVKKISPKSWTYFPCAKRCLVVQGVSFWNSCGFVCSF